MALAPHQSHKVSLYSRSNHAFKTIPKPIRPSITHQGHPVSVDVTASGDVRLRQLDAAEAAAASKSAKGGALR